MATAAADVTHLNLNRTELAKMIAAKIRSKRDELTAYWNASTPVKHCIIDDLLPQDLAEFIATSFPNEDVLRKRSSLRERKRVGVEIDKYEPIMGEILLAFHEPEVVEACIEVTGIAGMEADPTLYVSGLSAMREGDFLNPHLDNSHDGDESRYRAINLLYYITPEWKLENGGNLELWDLNVKNASVVHARFNRLVLMATDDKSWHSVTKVIVPGRRQCVSNYYFTKAAPGQASYKHLTTFAGRPDEPFKKFVLSLDGWLRNSVKKVMPFLHKRNWHRRDIDETQSIKKPK